MNNFEHLQALMQQLDQVEDSLKVMRDKVETQTKPYINASIAAAQAMRGSMWQIDKALEKEIGG
jgi:division protein CdvB (Snf7/Vps24/ESCRT-III family)